MRVFAYYRVSTQQQVDKNGLDRQRDTVTTFVDAKGWTILRPFSEQQSGGAKVEDRRMLLEMLDLAPAFNVEAIVVERADRVARDLMAQEIFFVRCAERNIQVYAADSGQELTVADGDPSRVMLRQMLGVIAQWEKAVIVKKLQDGRRRTKARTGRPCGGRRPYGLNPDPAVQADERYTLNYIRARRREGWTYLKIAHRLRERGILNPSGERYWHASTVYRLDRTVIDKPEIGPTS